LGAPLFVLWREERGDLTQRALRYERRVRREEDEEPKSTAMNGFATRGRMELSEGQMRVVERLFEAGFRPMAIPPYESALIMRRGECAAVLGPVENGGLKLLVPVTFLVDGNLSVKLKKSSGGVFVWKGKELEATEEKLRELEVFRVELLGILEMGGKES
jgi:hypothetical protein